MLMSSKFDSCCSKCGRPIFEGDLMEFNKVFHEALCVCCHLGYEVEKICPHWSVIIHNTKFTASNRVRYHRSDSPTIKCKICGTQLFKMPKNTTYIQHSTYNIHGGSLNRFYSTDSFIKKGKYNQSKNPDKSSIEALEYIIKNPNTPENIQNIALKHIKRINNYNSTLWVDFEDIERFVENESDLYVLSVIKHNAVHGVALYAISFISELFLNSYPHRLYLLFIKLEQLDAESISCYILLGFIGYSLRLKEDKIDHRANLYLSKVSDSLVNFIDEKNHKLDLTNTTESISKAFGISHDFYEIVLKCFSAYSESLKPFIMSELKNKTKLSFNECMKNHFPISYDNYFSMCELFGGSNSIEEWTLSIVKNYKGEYELEDSLLGALIMHVAIGNITGWDIDILLKRLNCSQEFEYDVKYRLHNKYL